jgi:orotidine-5'-phosphate decarboxylase
MMRAAADALAEEAARLGTTAGRPRLIAVTVLTSADAPTLEETGVSAPTVEAQVARLARLAAESGLDGVVASPHEISVVRQAVARADFLVVTPGVRTASAAHDDQKRVMTPAQAVRAGADYVVMGRAILKAPDPARAAREIIEEMEKAKE